MTSAPARAWLSAWRDEHLDGLVVEDRSRRVSRTKPSWPWLVYGSSATSVTRPSCGNSRLIARHALADEIGLVERLAASLVLELRLGIGEERDRRNVELAARSASRTASSTLSRSTPGIAATGTRRLLALDEEERPDQVVRRQHMLRNEPPRPFRLAVAARAMGEVEPVGFGDAGRLVHGGSLWD